MKSVITYILFTLILSNSCISQIVLNSKVIERNSKKPIPYVSINLASSKSNYDTDSLGQFLIQIPHDDTLLFSCIGYKPLKILAHDALTLESILLETQFEDLREVVLKKSPSLTCGSINKKSERSSIGDSRVSNSEMATLIKVSDSTNSFSINKILLRQKNIDLDNLWRLHIYSVGENGLPKDELLKQQIIPTTSTNESDILEIDIRNQNILCDRQNSFFIGIEWLNIARKNGEKKKGFAKDIGIKETYENGNVVTYRRSGFFNNKWFSQFENGFIVYDGFKTEIKLIPNKQSLGKSINMIAAAEIVFVEN